MFAQDAPNKDVTQPIRGLMTTYGYMVPDPNQSLRDSVWITGGVIEPHPDDLLAWKSLFTKHPPTRHGFQEKAQLLAVQLLMGAVLPNDMDPTTGKMEYSFTRPLGGHGFAYIDTLYSDSSLRIVQGHRGTYFVFSRMSHNSTYYEWKKSNLRITGSTTNEFFLLQFHITALYT